MEHDEHVTQEPSEEFSEAEENGLEIRIRRRLLQELARRGQAHSRVTVSPLARPLPQRDTQSRVFRCVFDPPVPGWGAAAIAKFVSPDDAPGGDVEEYGMLVRLRAQPAFAAAGFVAPDPLAHFPELRVILMGAVGGRPLSVLFATLNPAALRGLSSHVAGSGRLLRLLHDSGRLGALREVPAEVFEKIAEQTSRLPGDPQRRARLGARLSEACGLAAATAAGTEIPLVRRHGDFGLGNLFAKGERLAVLDFSYSAPDVIYNDIGSFLTSLETRCPISAILGTWPLRTWRASFLTTYFGSDAWRSGASLALISLYSIRQIVIRYRAEAVASHGRRPNALERVRLFHHRTALEREVRRLRRCCSPERSAGGG